MEGKKQLIVVCFLVGLFGQVVIGKTLSKEKIEKKESSSKIEKSDEGERDSKAFGMTIPLPNIPGLTPGYNVSRTGFGSVSSIFPNFNQPTTGPGPLDGTMTGTIGSGAILLKGGLIGILAAIKAALLPPLFILALIVFLVAGGAYFTCSVLDCGGLIASKEGFGGPSPGFGPNNPFNRHSFEYYDQNVRPVYQAFEDSYQKYGI